MTQFCLPVVEQAKVFLRIQFHFNKYIYIISTSIVTGACWKIWRPIKCLLCGFFFYKVELYRKSTNLTSFQFYFGLIILKPIMLEIKMIFFFHESCRHCWTALLCTYLKHSVTIEKNYVLYLESMKACFLLLAPYWAEISHTVMTRLNPYNVPMYWFHWATDADLTTR